MPRALIATSLCDTPPRLRAGECFSDHLTHALNGSIADISLTDPLCTVDWAGFEPTHAGTIFTLALRCRGVEVARATALAGEPLSLAASLVPTSVAAGEGVVCVLQWAQGEGRHLHLIPSLPLSFTNLVTAHRAARPSVAEPASISMSSVDNIESLARNLCSPTLPLPLAKLDRGFGIEIETLTVAGPGRPDALTSPNPGVAAVIAAVVEQLEASTASSSRSRAALSRVRRWIIGEDGMIGGSLDEATRRTVEACAPEDTDLATCLLSATPRVTHRTEIRSPAPPHELSFRERGADEVRCFVKLLRHANTATPSIGRTHAFVEPAGACCDAATAVHVHVNVRGASARGTLLSAREIVHVVLAWVRFDLVTARCCRAWMWRNVDSLPLFATGPEFVRLKNDRTQLSLRAGEANVPAWFSAVHALLRTEAFQELDEAAQVAAVFGEGSPTSTLGRYCSLNLQSVAKHGTLEVRRHHGSLDGERLTHWAHLLVAFVEAFRSRPAEAQLLELPLVDGLRELQLAQECASPEELMAGLSDHVDSQTVEMLMADAVGAPWEAQEEEESSEEATDAS